MVINWLESAEKITPGDKKPRRAAEYVRMSTEHQKYSTDNQSAAIQKYADQRHMQIVRTYADEGKSGLKIEGRKGLQQLLQDVKTGDADFDVLLVYDVSRWGRFQDPDEAASYELSCRQAGVEVHYCAEEFENDGSISSSIIKTVKRAMAGEYSRELSVKVFAGQANLIRLGYRQGGAPGFGLRRMLVDQEGNEKGILDQGEQKSISTDRVILVPGPEHEVRIVRKIFSLFVNDRMTEQQIADRFNGQGIVGADGQLWSRGLIHRLLINEKYIGNNVWAKTSYKLKGALTRNLPSQWIRADGAFLPLVSSELFEAAKEIIAQRSIRLSDDEMLSHLSQILRENGTLSGLIIDEYAGGPSSSAFKGRFGSLLRAYTLIGFQPDRDYSFLKINHRLREFRPEILESIIAGLEAHGAHVEQSISNELLTVNFEYTISINIARCFKTASGSLRWKIGLSHELRPDFMIAVRMDEANSQVKDYYILPQLDLRTAVLKLAGHNGFSLDAFRYDTLHPFFALAKRTSIRAAA